MMILGAIGHYLYNYVFGLGGIGAIISVAAWLLWYFTPALLAGSKTAIFHVAIVATALTVANTYLSAHYFALGHQTTINQIAAQDAKALKEAADAKGEVDKCFASGGDWDVSTGVCNAASKP